MRNCQNRLQLTPLKTHGIALFLRGYFYGFKQHFNKSVICVVVVRNAVCSRQNGGEYTVGLLQLFHCIHIVKRTCVAPSYMV